MSLFGLSFWQQCLPAILFLLLCAGAAAVAHRLLGPAVARLARKLGHPHIALVAEAFLKPAALCMLAVGVWGASALLPEAVRLALPALGAVGTICSIACIVFITWGLLRAANQLPALIEGIGAHLPLATGRALAVFIMRIVQALVLLVAAAMVLAELGYNINGVLAGLGLGGLSFALAGQDMVSNFFGGLVLVTERPFEIGDWVSTPDVEGTVEDISLRSTKVRTLENALVIVPNSKFTTTPITNWTRMKMRLARFTLGLEYKTSPAALQSTVQAVEAMLKGHEGVHAGTVQVRPLDFGPSSLDVTVQFYTKTTDITEYRAVREDINLRILDILAAQGVSLAFPSRSLYVASTAPARRKNHEKSPLHPALPCRVRGAGRLRRPAAKRRRPRLARRFVQCSGRHGFFLCPGKRGAKRRQPARGLFRGGQRAIQFQRAGPRAKRDGHAGRRQRQRGPGAACARKLAAGRLHHLDGGRPQGAGTGQRVETARVQRHGGAFYQGNDRPVFEQRDGLPRRVWPAAHAGFHAGRPARQDDFV